MVCSGPDRIAWNTFKTENWFVRAAWEVLLFSSHAWTTLNGWIKMQTGTIQGHHPKYIFFKWIFPCMGTSTSLEYTRGTRAEFLLFITTEQHHKTEVGYEPSGILLHQTHLMGLSLLPHNFPAPATPALLPLGSAQWAKLVQFSISGERDALLPLCTVTLLHIKSPRSIRC